MMETKTETEECKPQSPRGAAQRRAKVGVDRGPEEVTKSSQQLLHVLHNHEAVGESKDDLHLNEQQLARKVIALVHSGAQVNCQDADLNTPLHIAAAAGYVHVTSEGLTARDVATGEVCRVLGGYDLKELYDLAETGSQEEFASLFAHFAARDDFPEGNVKPVLLHLACRADNRTVVRYLVQRLNAALNYKVGGQTPLYHAVRSKDYELIHLLMRLGADRRIGEHAEELSLLTREDKIIQTLLSRDKFQLNSEHDSYLCGSQGMISSFHVLRLPKIQTEGGSRNCQYVLSVDSNTNEEPDSVQKKQVERFCRECCLSTNIQSQSQTEEQTSSTTWVGYYSFAMTDSSGLKSFGHLGVFRSGESQLDLAVVCLLSAWPFFTYFRELIASQQEIFTCEATSLEDVAAQLTNTYAPLMKVNIVPTSIATIPAGIGKGNEIDFPSWRRMPYVDDKCFDLLFASIASKNLVDVFSALLTEQRVLLLTDCPAKLTLVAEALVSLLFPFEWNHIYIPLLSEDALEVVQAPLPFLLGICTEQLKSVPGEVLTSMVLVFLDRDSVVMPMNFGIQSSAALQSGSTQAQMRYETEQRHMSLPPEMHHGLLRAIKTAGKNINKFRSAFFSFLIELISPLHAFHFEKRKVADLLTTRYKTSKPFYETFFETQVWKSFHLAMTTQATCFESDLRLAFIKEVLDRRLGLERIQIVADHVSVYKHRTVMSRKLGKLVAGDTVYIEKRTRSTSSTIYWSKPRGIAGWCLLRDRDYRVLQDRHVPYESYVTGTNHIFSNVLSKGKANAPTQPASS